MLKIHIEFKKGILFVRLDGDLTEKTSDEFNRYIIPLIKDNGIRFLVYNLNEVTKIDNFGIKALKIGKTLTKENMGRFVLCTNFSLESEEFEMIKEEREVYQLIKV